MTQPGQQRDIPGLDVPRAKRYSRLRLTVLFATLVWNVVRFSWFALSGRSARMRRATRHASLDDRLATPMYLIVVSALSWLTSLPLAYVGGHALERRYQLTKQSDQGWLGDQLKGLAVGMALQTPLLTGAFAVIRRRPNDWWLILSAATVPLAVILGNLAPVLILPLFNKFEPIADPAVTDRIKRLATEAGVPIAGVYRMDMSRQTEKPNAFFTGLGQTKRIVLSDTLLDRFTPAEVDAVVAHELGHQVHGDVWRQIALMSGLGFGAAYATHRLAPPLIERTAHRTGVTGIDDEASLPLLALILTGLSATMLPVISGISRAIERRTDRWALQLTRNGPAYTSLMAGLAAQGLADPDPPAPVVFFLYSHPPVAERIAIAEAFSASESPSI